MKSVIFATLAKITAPVPLPAIAAPINPPTNVCDELDGMPSHHVIRFQIIAAIIAEKIRFRVTILGSITPFPIVFATFNGKIRKARKLHNVARLTADIGDSTFVETTVAMELAESWKPLIKSKSRTTPIVIIRNVIFLLLIF
jgi:hypothetical protein